MTHLAGGQEGVLQGGGHGDPAVGGEARVQSSEQADWAHEATPTLPHSVTPSVTWLSSSPIVMSAQAQAHTLAPAPAFSHLLTAMFLPHTQIR